MSNFMLEEADYFKEKCPSVALFQTKTSGLLILEIALKLARAF